MFGRTRYENLLKIMQDIEDRVSMLEEKQKILVEAYNPETNDELKRYVRQCVYGALDNWVSNRHDEVVTTLDGKKIETKYVNDARRELQAKKLDLERILEYVEGELDKYKGEEK